MKAMQPSRPARLAFLLLRGLDHFAHELVAAVASPGEVETRCFYVDGPAAIGEAMAWADDPARDALWFEFCWPPFQQLLAATDFGGRRVIMRVHRIEAYGTDHAARAPWHQVDDAIVVSDDMAARLRGAAPAIDATTRVHVIHNGLDFARFVPSPAPDPYRIGWCGWLSLHKNPGLALQVLHHLRQDDPRWELHISTKGGEPVAIDSLSHLTRRLGLKQAVHIHSDVPQERMPDWHASNGVLLSTSVYESFGYAICEAAAVGCDLAILDYAGAGEFWPREVLFGTVEEAAALIRSAAPHRWREHVTTRYSLARQAAAVRALMAEPRLGATRPHPTLDTASPGDDGLAAGGETTPISHGAWRGRFPIRDRADHIQRVILSTGGFYEKDMLEDLRKHLRPGSLFVDVGANIGNHALFAAAVCGARVLAFEPSPTLADHCAASLAVNGLSSLLTLRREGAGASDGVATLIPGPAGNAGMTHLDFDGAAQGERIPVVRVDDALAQYGDLRPAVLKVDVEGMEVEVLTGATRTIEQHQPVLYVETATDESFAAVDAFLWPLGYQPVARFNATPTWVFVHETRL